MSAALGSSSVPLTDFIRMTTFRWTLIIAGAFFLCTLLLFGFVYLQTASYMTSEFDDLIIGELRIFAAEPPEQWAAHINERLENDPRRVRIAGLFGADGHRIAGNIESLPGGMTPGAPSDALIVRIDNPGHDTKTVRLMTEVMPDGDVLAIGRDIEEIGGIAKIVQHALALGLLPALGLAIVVGLVLSWRAQHRLLEVNRHIQRIVAGDLRERLPTSGGSDPFDRLAVNVNRMLGDIEALINEVAGVGND